MEKAEKAAGENTMTACSAEHALYYETDIDAYRSLLFDEVISTIDGGDVCDIGCGLVGPYWMLGYIERVDSVSLYDCNPLTISTASERLDSLTPERLEEQYYSTYQHLLKKGIVTSSLEELCISIVEKTYDTSVVDTLDPTTLPDARFDHCIAMESLECVADAESFIVSLSNTLKLLKPGGHLAMAILRYNERNQSTNAMVSQRLEGTLNPSRNTIADCLKKIPHKRSTIATHTDLGFRNYSSLEVVHVWI